MATAVSVVLIKERHIVEALERAGATDPSRARPLADVAVDPDGIAMRRLRARAIVRESAPGMYYADLAVWHATRRMRQRLVLVVLAVSAVVAGAALVTGGAVGRTP